jgi:hypothetical protein
VTREEAIRLGREINERELSPEEFDRKVLAGLADEQDLAERIELVRWFCRRYPTAGERLSYARRKVRELQDSPLRWPFDDGV